MQVLAHIWFDGAARERLKVAPLQSAPARPLTTDAVAAIEETDYVSLLALMRPPPHFIPGALRRTQKRRKVRVVARFDEAAHGVAHLGAEGYR